MPLVFAYGLRTLAMEWYVVHSPAAVVPNCAPGADRRRRGRADGQIAGVSFTIIPCILHSLEVHFAANENLCPSTGTTSNENRIAGIAARRKKTKSNAAVAAKIAGTPASVQRILRRAGADSPTVCSTPSAAIKTRMTRDRN